LLSHANQLLSLAIRIETVHRFLRERPSRGHRRLKEPVAGFPGMVEPGCGSRCR
jgi:hypothetical protein